ncbi:hypothetical protein K502DRAFT_286722 [Neoconidiobolus thromboides FSU 785]|nr:hypothetical protein K502DRAFT_286722 [Neoconidiobolus thromboides FSU 785]
MQEEYKNFDYNSVPLGLRPRFNFRALMRPLYDPDREGALVLYRPSKTISENEKVKLEAKLAKALQSNKEIEGLPEIAVVVDPRLAKVLRPHQVEGVKFLYDCVTGLRVKDNYGCIMADEMGLGKTLQCITLLWTLLKQSPTPGKATAERCVIACPSSLVNNWANELVKWLGKGRVNPIVCDYKDIAPHKVKLLTNYNSISSKSNYLVLIISYETLRSVVPQLGNAEIGLLLCDEGHRLKNSKNQTFQALNQLNVKRRVILSGTPIQNDLSEYFSILSFTNPNLLGSENEFRSNFENPILKGRDAAATQRDRDIGDEKLKELNAKVSKIIIRRTNDLLIKYLPTKYEHIVFCKLSDTQKTLYQKFINSKNVKNLLEEKSGQKATSLQAINILKKLVNHPSLLKYPEDIQGAEMIVPEYYMAQSNDRSARNAVRGGGYSDLNVEYSSKLVLLDNMLRLIRKTTTDKVVLISNYTQTLDMFEKLSKMRRFPFLRLDGSMTINKRQKLVDKFNDPEGNEFLFLLSSKAGGCGINLIGANRLFLFDPDWNPASDQQALARVWRDGQKKTCFIYRLIAVGTLEEKIFQRQSHKQALSNCVVDEEQSERHFSLTDLRELFKINEAECETHDTYGCKGSCDEVDRENSTYPDISSWSHFPKQSRHKLADKELKEATKDFDALSYVFQYKSHVSEIFKD